jgi:molybdenum cofactor synthesis domain-containing protein
MAPNAAAPTVLITVGDEILSGHTLDTNSHHLATALHKAGFPVRRIEVVGDAVPAIVAAIQRALAEANVTRVVVSGGIGPTPDDRTFEAVATALGRPLEENADALAHITALVQRMHEAGWLPSAEVSAGNRRCAMVPQGARVLRNPRGMAPPLAIDVDAERALYVLPGVPREFTAIVEEELVPHHFAGAPSPHVTELRYAGVPEATMYEPLRAVESAFPDVAVGSYPQSDRRELIIRFRGANESRVAAAVQHFRAQRGE